MARQVKLPVASVFGDAFAFSLRNFPTVLRLFLAALLVLTLPISGLLYFVIPNLVSSAAPLTSDMAPETIVALVSGTFGLWMALTLLIIMACGLLFLGMVLVPLTRLIVLEERPPAFSLNRLLGTFLSAWAVLTILTFVLISIALSTLVFPYANLLDPGGLTAPDWLPMVVTPLVFMLVFYTLIRLEWFLIDAIVHGSINLRRSWQLTRHNVWRLIALSLLVALAGSVVTNVIRAFALPLSLLAEDLPLADTQSTSIFEVITLALDRLAASPLALGAAMLVAMLYCWLIGFSYSVPAFGYKALTQEVD